MTSVKYIAPAKAQANTYAIPDPLTQDLMYLKLYPHGVIGTATSPDALHDKQVSYSGRTLSLLYPKTDKSKAGNPLIHRYHGAENKASKRNASVRVSEHSLSMKAAKANQHFYPVSVRYTTNSDKQRETGFFGHAQIVGEVRPVETTPVYDAFATGGCIIGGDLMAVSAQGERFSLTDPKTTFPANFAAATIHYDDEPHTYERYNEAMLKKLLNFVSAVRTPQAVFYYESPVIYYMIYGLTHYLRGVLSFELFTQYIDIVKKHHRWITERLEYFSLHFDINIVVTSVLDGLMISDLNPEEILKAFNDLAATPPLPLSQEQYQKYAQTLVSAIIDKLAKGTDEMATLHQYIQTQRAQQPDFLGKSGNPLVDLNRTSYAGLYAWIRLVTKKQVPNPELLVIVPQDETHILETYNLFSKHFGGLTAMAYSPLLMPQTDSKLFYLTKGKGLLNALIKKLVSLQGKMVSSMALDSPTAYAHYTEEIEKLLTSFTPNSVKPPAKPTSQHFSPRPFTPYHSVSSLHQDLTQEASTPRRIQLDIVPSPQTFRQLEQCLFLPSCPDAFSLVFSTPLNESSFNALMTLLQIQGHEKTFFLRFTSISDEQLRLLHTVLMTGKSSVSGIELRNYAGVSPPVTKDEYTDEGLRYLANALSSGHCAPDFALEIHAHQNITPRSYFYIHQALAAHAPKRLKLLVDSPDNDVANINELYTLLAGGLNNPKSLEVLELDIQTNDLPTQGLTALANALTSGQCPQTLCLRFRLRERENPSMRQETIIRLLSDQNTPPANTASYFQQGLTAFIKALSSEQCPKDLTLDFSALDLDETRYQQLLHCLRDIKSDKKLTLLLGKASYMDDRALEMLTEVLANNPDLPMLSISLKGDFTDEALIRMTDQLKTGPFRHPLTLKLDTQHTSFACQRQCFNALKTVSNLQIDIESSFSKKDIPFIEEQLSAGIYPQGFKDALAHFSTRTREKLEQLCDAYQHNLPEDKSAPLLKHVLLNEYYKATVNAWKTAKPNYAAFFKAEESKKNPPISVEHNANKSV
ncbi:hypothetical protein [Legionella shakespearei]|uniref:hypothetical protein n=1 Tax=Legionella shakespearei TaxID=45075 RepID=UPI001ED988EE|nr:hypothetical protein [Legionella shakespearei]